MTDHQLWLDAARRIAAEARAALAAIGPADRANETGDIGAGGDRTLLLDVLAEDAVFSEMSRIAEHGVTFSVISEERGVASFGAQYPLVVVDPVDGSLNARRGGSHYALSLAVASGPELDAISFGYIYDFGASEEWWAAAGCGAYHDGQLLAPTEERTVADGRLELLAIETNDARRLAEVGRTVGAVAYKIRTPGSIAVAICHVACGRVDAMVNLSRCRGVDIAAATLIARETGASSVYPGARRVPKLDLTATHAVVVARSSRMEAALTELVSRSLP